MFDVTLGFYDNGVCVDSEVYIGVDHRMMVDLVSRENTDEHCIAYVRNHGDIGCINM